MLKKKITYFNFEDVEETKEFHFNINKLELARLAAKYGGDLRAYLEKLIADKDEAKMLSFLEEIVQASVGEKNQAEGTFVKDEGIRNRFVNSNAYAELIFEVGSSDEKAMAFFGSVFPKEATAPPKN